MYMKIMMRLLPCTALALPCPASRQQTYLPRGAPRGMREVNSQFLGCTGTWKAAVLAM